MVKIPWEQTDEYIRSGHRSPEDFQEVHCEHHDRREAGNSVLQETEVTSNAEI